MSDYRTYSYVGSHALLELLQQPGHRIWVRKQDDVLQWIEDTKQLLDADNAVIATFIIDTDQHLWIADRRSEHVVCANGQEVLSAGEITFEVINRQAEVIEVTNQSTGYCPEPESWWAVASALEQIGISYPSDFTTAFLFRRCESCGTTNIVKDMWFECAVCQTPLSERWNYNIS
jgi:hypothetical protein